jgi:hypothetical protein
LLQSSFSGAGGGEPIQISKLLFWILLVNP